MNGPISKGVSSALPRAFSRRSAILKIVEEKALETRLICQPCDLRMIVVSTVPDNALLRKLRVLHPTKFWIFSPIDKNSVLSR